MRIREKELPSKKRNRVRRKGILNVTSEGRRRARESERRTEGNYV